MASGLVLLSLAAALTVCDATKYAAEDDSWKTNYS